jgi:hypothetical protein
MKIKFDFRPFLPYVVFMIITHEMLRLQAIITDNEEAAESGCHQAQGQVVNAEEELDALSLEPLTPTLQAALRTTATDPVVTP